MQDFAQPFPVRVIGDLLGLPAADQARNKAWSDALALVVEPAATRELRQSSDHAARELLQYLRGIVAQRRQQPRDDVLGSMLAAQAADGNVSDEELLANLMLLFVAGHETTTNLIGNGVLCLLQHPAQLQRLRQQPGLMACAVEEVMRFQGPANVVARVATEARSIGVHTVPAGDLVYCLTAAANRDPQVFAQPDQFDIGREDNPHLSMGGGVHYCLGAPLARLETAVAFERLLARFPRLQLQGGPVTWRPLVNLRGLSRLMLSA
jgi:pimeloyl-[acyl-carrier protein] synthase